MRKLLFLPFILTSCASLNNREKTLLMMAGGGAIGGLIGANSAPKGESKVGHGLLWGGIAASASGALGLFINNDQKVILERERQIEALKLEVQAATGELNIPQNKVAESQSTLERDLPSEYKGLVRPGKWSIYKINKWISQDEHTFIHQDKILKIEPPHFSGGSKQ